MRSFVIVFIFFSYTFDIYSQIIITDINNEPIPFVQVISNNKYFFVESNIAGRIEEIDINNLAATDTLFFHHVSYKSEFKVKRDLSRNDTIHLEPRIYELAEASISTNSKKKKFALIDACYRSYQANNDSIAYYTDGKVKYQSKVKKYKFKLFRKEYRSFVNTTLEDEEPNRKVAITFVPSIPKLRDDYLPSNFFAKHKIKQIKNDTGKVEIYNEDGFKLGEIEVSPAFIKYYIDDLYSVFSRKALETEVNLIKEEVILIFRNKNYSTLSEIENFDNLLYFKMHTVFNVKHNKDKKYRKINDIDEIFVENVSYTDTLENLEYSSRVGMPKTSKYATEFWKTCNCEAYYLPNEYLFRGLQEK